MPVLLFSGLPGSGKSYGVVKNVIVPCLKAGRTVITNIPLKADRLGEDIGAGSIVPFTDDLFEERDIHARYPGAVWVLDEVWRWWPSGLTATKLPDNHAEFFRMHRHSVGDDGKTSEIVIITQDPSDVAKCVRVTVEFNYHAVKLSHLGSDNRCRIDIYRVESGERSTLVRNIFDKYEKPFTEYYQSHTKIAASSDITQGAEVRIDNRGSIWKRPIIKIAIFAIVVVFPTAIYFGVKSFNKVVHHEKPIEHHQPVSKVPDPAPVPAPGQAEKLQPAEVVEKKDDDAKTSDYWRYAGYFDGDSGRVWLVQSNDQRVRQLPSDGCFVTPGTTQHVCTVDGVIVTEWTGSRVTVSAALTGNQPR